MYTCSLDRTARVWDSGSGRLLLSATCPAFLRAVTADPAETFLFAAGGGGVIYQVGEIEESEWEWEWGGCVFEGLRQAGAALCILYGVSSSTP